MYEVHTFDPTHKERRVASFHTWKEAVSLFSAMVTIFIGFYEDAEELRERTEQALELRSFVSYKGEVTLTHWSDT